MSMMRFGLLFRDLAERETRTCKVIDPLPADDPRHLPVDEYGFDELYCVERKCDCRRVIINVLARDARAHVATINHAFEQPAKGDVVDEQTFLDPLNKQSRWSPALLDLFVNVVLGDGEYRQRLLQHYRIFKNAVNDVTHPCQRIIRASGFADLGELSAARRTPIPPSSRRTKRKKW